MTIEQKDFDELKKQNADLTNQLKNNSRGVEGLLAQLDGHKGMINDNIAQNLNLRSQLSLIQKQGKALADENKRLQEVISGLEKQLADANAEIKKLSTPAAPPPENPEATLD